MDEAAKKKNQMHTSEGNLSLRPDLMMDGARIICKKNLHCIHTSEHINNDIINHS
jgi:hypothetical protein